MCPVAISTGSPCQPEVDNGICRAGALDCTCGAARQWTCVEAGAGGAGGNPSAGAGAIPGIVVSAGGAGGGLLDPAIPDPAIPDPSSQQTAWLPSWATTLQRTEDGNEPPPLGGKTLRQFVYPSYSGSEIRILLSNERGNAPVDITKVHMAHAQSLGQGQIDASTDTEFMFGGSASVTIPQGETVWSDALAFPLKEMEPMAVTMHFANAPSDVTGHPGARTTSYVTSGDVVSEASLGGGAETRPRWYFISEIQVMAPADAYAIAVLGDSITDGYGVLDDFARWPDFLNEAISDDPMIAGKVSVLNFGMGANSLTVGNADMDPGIERFERDVLGRREKIRWLVILIGVNDMIYSNVGAGAITAAYQDIADRSHEAGILVYGSPITPFAGHTQGNALNVRTEVNSWVTSSNAYDAVIDLAAAIADPGNAAQIASSLNNDGLHPSIAGYEAMGRAVDLSLFYNTMQ
jgi:lysophospholipase L1-like esterase